MGVLDGPLRSVTRTVYSTVVSASTLTRTPRGDYNPITDERFIPPSVSYPIHLLVESYDRRYIDGKTVLEGDMRGSFPAVELPFEPSPELDVVVRPNGDRFRIVGPVSTTQLDSAILYEVQLRKERAVA